jgi:hypothetical protein
MARGHNVPSVTFYIVMLIAVVLNVVVPIVVMLNVVVLKVVMLIVVMLIVIVLKVVMLNVVVPNVAAPLNSFVQPFKWKNKHKKLYISFCQTLLLVLAPYLK